VSDLDFADDIALTSRHDTRSAKLAIRCGNSGCKCEFISECRKDRNDRVKSGD